MKTKGTVAMHYCPFGPLHRDVRAPSVKFEELLIAFKTGVHPEEAAEAARVAEEATKAPQDTGT